MTETAYSLMLQFLGWLVARRRTYDETMGAWQSHCPRHTTWEDAVIDGLVRIENDVVVLTAQGEAFLNNARQGDGTGRPESVPTDRPESGMESVNESSRALLGRGQTSTAPPDRARCG